jgi:DNA replication protein DnaC
MKRLMNFLEIRQYEAVGLVESLIQMALDYVPDTADVGRYPDADIAQYLDWPGDPVELIHAFVKAGWLDACDDQRLVVHDWRDHAPSYLKDRWRKREQREEPPKNVPDNTGTSKNVQECPPNPTQPNPTQPNQKEDSYTLSGNVPEIPDGQTKDDPEESISVCGTLVWWLAWWNGLHASKLVAAGVNQNKPNQTVQRAWKRCQNNRDVKEMLADPEKIRREIELSSFCQAAGWFRLEKLFGGTNKDGELILRKLLEGGFRDDQSKNRKLSGSYEQRQPSKPGRVYEETLPSHDEDRPTQREVFGKVQAFAADMPARLRNGGGVVLYGRPGTGKDHLLCALAFWAILRHGFEVLWENGGDLYQRARERIHDDTSERRFLEMYVKRRILMISDPIPPKGDTSPYATELVQRIVDRRYRDLKSTWVTLNVKDGQEAEERLASPLIDRFRHKSLCCKCNWQSYRERDRDVV